MGAVKQVEQTMSAGVAVAGGGSESSMKNSKGVVISLSAAIKGINFALAPSRVTISLSGTPF